MLLKKVNKAHTANGQVVIFKKTKSNNLLKLTIMKRNFTLTFAFLLLTVVFVHANSQTTLWSENFEGDWTANWYVENGTWEVGEPTSGPNAAFNNSNNCVATVLGGNYADGVETRLIRFTSFSVPSASQNPRLRFWHWYSFGYNDYGKVQVKVQGTSDWIDVSTSYTNTGSNIWTHPFIDLSDYAGQSVQIAFYFKSQSGGESLGWYIDDVEIVTGPIVFNNPENWENGIGDWASERGTWEVGTPSGGPGSAYGGENCAATVLKTNYSDGVSSMLTSPLFSVPSASENPRLRFWHWYSFGYNDYGKVQVKVQGTSDWIDVSTSYTNTGSNIWTHPFIDLSDYAGQSVQIAFYFKSQSGGESLGWYIDDVEIVTGPIVFNNPENWENGIGDWASERGTWEVGTPSGGPGSAYGGENCAATVLKTNYSDGVSSMLTSPLFSVPSASENPRLRFWHWYSFGYNDYGKVQVKVQGTSDWIDVSTSYTNTGSNIWTHPFIDLSDYAGQSVQIAFYFKSQSGGESLGWYIDDVEIVTGPIVFNNPENWENGIGDWASERGTWEVGTPSGGPGSAYGGENCAATVLKTNYSDGVSSMLTSPLFSVPSASENPRLRFWHWYSFGYNDYGKVQVKVQGTSDWIDVSTSYTNTGSNIWTHPFIDLSDYAGQSVQIAFYFKSQSGGESLGWYIDDVEIVTGPIVFNNPENWENGIGDWASERGTWEVGTPSGGPGSAYGGENCAATVLKTNYSDGVSSMLTSPIFSVPSASENPRLRFWHWYSFGYNDYGKVQVKVQGTSDWIDVSTSYTNTGSNIWTYTFIDLSNYAGQSVQIAFYFNSRSGGESLGWYIDDIIIEGDKTQSNKTDFTTFTFGTPPQTGNATIDATAKKIDIEVDSGTDVTNLISTFALSDGATATVGAVTQTSGTTVNDFSSPVTYTVTAEDGTTTQDWVVTVTKAVVLNDETDILTYSFGMPPQTGDAAINSSLHTIGIEVEAGTDITNLVATFTLSDGATAKVGNVDQESGVTANDFSSPVTYTITAEDGTTTQDWTVTVTKAVVLNDETDILTYSFGMPPQTGDAAINSSLHTIGIEVEAGTDITNLVATFTLSDGATAKVGDVDQESGITANDFSSPVTYTITAEDGTTTQDWTVTVTKAVVLNDETDILTYSFGIPPQTGSADINSGSGNH